MTGFDALFHWIFAPYAQYAPWEIAIEATAVFFGIWSVVLARKNHIGVYPTGIVSTGIYMYVTVSVGLYADGFINLYYTLMSIYGWYAWTHVAQHEAERPITQLTPRAWRWVLYAFIGLFMAFYIGLTEFTDSNVAWADATTTSLAFIAMALMARRHLEHWYFWLATNVISIPLYLYKELALTSFQFMVFTYLAYTGWRSWLMLIKPQPK